MTADERRETIIDAAQAEFAGAGLAGASTEAIARRGGISHAYLFRLFGTKHQLFLAACESCMDKVTSAFRAASANRPPDEPVFAALGQAYRRLIEDDPQTAPLPAARLRLVR